MRAMALAKLTIFNQLTHDYTKNDSVILLLKKKNGVPGCGLFRGRRGGGVPYDPTVCAPHPPCPKNLRLIKNVEKKVVKKFVLIKKKFEKNIFKQKY